MYSYSIAEREANNREEEEEEEISTRVSPLPYPILRARYQIVDESNNGELRSGMAEENWF